MSTVKTNNVQVGQSGTATNNFTLYQPTTPDGTLRLAVGNSGATTGDVLSVSGTGLSVTGTLSATGNVTLSGGTANGVLYLNGSKVATSGSALTFNGTVLSNAQSSASSGLLFSLQNTSTGSYMEFAMPGVANVRFGAPNADAFVWQTFGSGTYPEQMRLTSTGLGIGTSSPATKMVVAGTDPGTLGLSYIYSTDSATQNKGGQLTFGGSYTGTTTTYFAAIAGRKESATSGNYDGYLQFLTRNAASDMREVMRLDSSGNLGLGVTPSVWTSFKALEVTGGAIGGITTNQFDVVQNAYYNSGFKYKTTGAASLYQQAGTGHGFYSAASGSADASISWTQVLGFGKDTSVVLQGASSQAGTGITFPATQSASSDANTLDDYEEGTFTVSSLTPNTSGTITISTSQNVLKYTKIGRVVYINGFVAASGVSSPVGFYITLAGLPFNVTNSSSPTTGANYQSGVAIFYYSNTTGTGQATRPITVPNNGGTSCFLSVDASTVTTSTEIYININYAV